MAKFLFEWANGSEIAEGKNYKLACQNLKTKPSKILTGMLVRIKPLESKTKEDRKKRVWVYWDAEQFWKYKKKETEVKK